MTDDMTKDGTEPSLPPTTVPANLHLSLMHFPQDPELLERFGDLMASVIRAWGQVLDLGRLAGVTAGFDFDAALASVDLGYSSERAREYTNNGDILCVAKAMRVLRDEKVMSHVVFNANVLLPLLDPQDEDYLQALHIIAHEFGHVEELKWRDEAMPGILLRPYPMPWGDAMLNEIATTVWEEYAACRLTAAMGDEKKMRGIYVDNFAKASMKALEGAQARIIAYRTHGDVGRLLSEAGQHLMEPLRLAGYMLGHLDGGLDYDNLAEPIEPDLCQTMYSEILPRLHCDLREIWSSRETWQGLGTFDGLAAIAADAFGKAGMHLRKQGEGFYVDVPPTAATMPNGEADMIAIRAGALVARDRPV